MYLWELLHKYAGLSKMYFFPRWCCAYQTPPCHTEQDAHFQNYVSSYDPSTNTKRGPCAWTYRMLCGSNENSTLNNTEPTRIDLALMFHQSHKAPFGILCRISKMARDMPKKWQIGNKKEFCITFLINIFFTYSSLTNTWGSWFFFKSDFD